MSRRLKATNTQAILSFCSGLLVGLVISRLGVSTSWSWLILIIPLIVISYRQSAWVSILTIITAGILIGNIRGNNYLDKISIYDELNLQKVEITAIADNDAQYNKNKQLEFDVVNIKFNYPKNFPASGKMKISGFGENSIQKGDSLKITGKLYKTRGSRQASISYAQIEKNNSAFSPVDDVRRSFSAGVSNVLPDPQAPFGIGLLIGQKTTLGAEPTEWLAIVGLTHIIAVSGYNLTIIVRFITRVFGKRSRYQTLFFSTLIITLFLLMTGFSASIVRASIVCSISLFAWYFGRKVRSMVIIFSTAALSAMWYPLYIWSDIGWYLSFLAFFGVLVLAPIVTKRIFTDTPKALTSAFIETICAQIMTAPLIIYVFGEFSSISIISNLLVMMFIPIAMLFTLIAGIAGMISPSTLYFLAIPANIILSYILFVASKLSKVPYATVSINLSLLNMLAIYITIFITAFLVRRKLQVKYGTITEEKFI